MYVDLDLITNPHNLLHVSQEQEQFVCYRFSGAFAGCLVNLYMGISFAHRVMTNCTNIIYLICKSWEQKQVETKFVPKFSMTSLPSWQKLLITGCVSVTMVFVTMLVCLSCIQSARQTSSILMTHFNTFA